MPRGARPGERRGGRPKGVPNKATLEIKEAARQYGPKAVEELARLAGLTNGPGSDSEQTRVSAIRELLDRGYGKSTQPISGDANAAPVKIEYGASAKLNGLIDAIAKRSGEAG
jgi:hypothetical protein